MQHRIEVERQCNMYNNILETGYYEFQNNYFTKLYYRRLYNYFDNFIELISKIPSFEEKVNDFEVKFLEIYREPFCGTPTGFRDCSKKLNKKDQKIYFQFCTEYYSLIKRDEKARALLDEFVFLKIFLNYLDMISNKSKILLNESIDTLERDVPGLRKTLMGDRKELTVVIRLLRYYGGSDKLCTSPHFDKSGLTLLLDNNDPVDAEKFIIGPYRDQFDPNQLSKPKRQFIGNKNYSSTLLFPGACLKLGNLPMNPVPHAALPAPAQHRYSLIAFCLVPNINTTVIQTTVFDKEEFKQVVPMMMMDN